MVPKMASSVTSSSLEALI
ncbi:hypothetical protein Goklo_000107 [Gossypium klotzschianum]|uniref:Uncharacterized protein n=1 Tax=Gossypium klotzschianum TaxID=34286 RepID=A0A7J8WD16_9ROSI|nr:hypothetical protein [Gossypium klotzschianum]